MSNMRAAIILPSAEPDPWYADNLASAFRTAARDLAAAGWEVRLLDETAAADALPLLGGAGPATFTAALKRGYRLAQCLREVPPDLVLAPLRQGLAQPLLMARATGEDFARTAVAVWGDWPTAERLRRDDLLAVDPSALIDDALEHCVLRHADFVLAPSAALAAALPANGAAVIPARWPGADVPGTQQRPQRLAGSAIRELVCVGPGSPRYGIPRFLDAVERLGRLGVLHGRCVTLLGPWRDAVGGLGKNTLGIRARQWSFDFKQIDAATPSAALAYLQAPGKLPVFAGDAVEDQSLVAAVAGLGLPLLINAAHPLAGCSDAAYSDTLDGLPLALEKALRAGADASARMAGRGWLEMLEPMVHSRLRRPPRIAAAAGRVCICIAHRDRPECLENAIASISPSQPPDVDVVVVDNASDSTAAQRLLDRLESRPRTRVIRLSDPETEPQVRNRAAAATDAEILIFLDDDNVLVPGAVERWQRAFAGGNFDIVVSSLDLVDGDPAHTAPSARLLFLGDAGSAGLFFNAFGDSNFAILHTAFVRAGGFDGEGPSGPAPDWIFLAKARAAGLRIGVLQQPAVRYARSLAAAARNWRKYDQEGARSAVLRAYGGRFDAELVARVALAAMLPIYSG
jgi:hypothetical protein